jgi:hypothetical protein
MLLFNSVAAVAGPNLFIQLRKGSEADSIHNLLLQVDADKFQDRFGVLPVDTAGVPSEAVNALVDAKTLTISKLLSLAPATTPDPTPYIYDSTMYTMAGLVCVAGVSHNLIRPVDTALFKEEPGVVIDTTGGAKNCRSKPGSTE